MPGRTFQGPNDCNRQLVDWLEKANQRQHPIIECRPADRLSEDRAAMVALPPRPPALGWRWSTRLPRDHYVRVQSCDDSVHPPAVGRRVEVVCALERGHGELRGLTVQHPRSWVPHRTITAAEHVAAAERMRRTRRRAFTCTRSDEVEVRPLSVYDAAFAAGEGVA
jgi:hypothetical protein